MIKIVRRTGYQWLVHDNPSSAATITFYSLFTLAPTLVFGVTIGKYVIGWYLARAIIASAYGTSSSLVAIMIWIYYSSQTLLLGAEVTHYAAE